MKALIDKLFMKNTLEPEEYSVLISGANAELSEYLFEKARLVSQKIFGKKIYMRGLIEITNYCKNDCYYCGIRRSNTNCERYRLTAGQILDCCETGYGLGFRTFVMQGGEDSRYTDGELCDIVGEIRCRYPDCAITLSLGERSYESYERFFQSGADRYLLRHETINPAHYSQLHPAELTIENRRQCLYNLKKIGYQVGTGFMVGSPYQTVENIVEDLMFLKKFSPHMVGIGPFIPHKDTVFAVQQPGSLELTLFLTGLIRLMLPEVLLPATTAVGTLDPRGREKSVLAGANVIMPNLSPSSVRSKYLLYDNKAFTGAEAAESTAVLEEMMAAIGYKTVVERGDSPNMKRSGLC